MNFPMVGTITSNIRLVELNQKWEKRKEEFTKPVEEQKNSILESLKEDMERIRKSNEINAIYTKMKCGSELSQKDLDYLRTNSPQLYEKAVKIAKEREQYRKELERCQTKEDVQTLNTNKINSLFNEAKSIMGNASIPASAKLNKMEEIEMRLNSIQNEHMKFISTPKYSALPERREDKKEREGEEKVSEKDPSRELQKILELLRKSTYRLPQEFAANEASETDALQTAEAANVAESADGSEPAQSAQETPVASVPANTYRSPQVAQTVYTAQATAVTPPISSATPQAHLASGIRLSKKV